MDKALEAEPIKKNIIKKTGTGKGTVRNGGALFGIILPAIIFLTWFIVTENGVFSSAILPSIKTVWESFLSQAQSGQLAQDLGVSLVRVLKGFCVASVLGIMFGVLMGISEKTDRFFSLTFNSIRQIPMMAWIPLIILWFGIDELSKTVIIVLGAFFPVLVNTISGIKEVPKGFIEVGKMYRLSKWELFRKIYFPSAIPSIFVGLKLSLGYSWMVVVAAELVSASSGIGYRINDARSLMQPEVVIVGMFAIGIIGILMDKILAGISRRITPWTADR
ncbi:ABC transporter permease [Parasporobacterium paucivorans]|uniref:Sulfonate transport system permease protein n=1 Tax=Parasporobacterium paucivorans DSM 15970 TaxID=1122934 RepID=A0A1M6E040_9FIRM|nr:ABC transporter permease [Parasporobacterium paucivorans]SHI78846.1 sulfonate transport system permease protein [Parasporobacterium paucivorans DSM 15970]